MFILYEMDFKTVPVISKDEIHVLEVIGKGSFGEVYKAHYLQQIVAVKKVVVETQIDAIINEACHLSKLQHENIIKIYGASFNESSKLGLLVMEYADCGSLYQLLHSNQSAKYNLGHSISWLLQCAKAVAYLHSHRPEPILHRDLKPLNLLLTKGALIMKVCDFGTACTLRSQMTDNKGSPAWMAPEVFEAKSYSEKCDVYSLGIILWEVLTRLIPYKNFESGYQVLWAVTQNRRPPLIQGCPRTIEKLMECCWSQEPKLRPTMSSIVEVLSRINKFVKGGDKQIQLTPSDTSSSGLRRSSSYGTPDFPSRLPSQNTNCIVSVSPSATTGHDDWLASACQVSSCVIPCSVTRQTPTTPLPPTIGSRTPHSDEAILVDGTPASSGAEQSSSGASIGEDDLGNYWEYLEDHLKPIPPIESCPESKQIFLEHKEKAKSYLILQQEIYNVKQMLLHYPEELKTEQREEQQQNQRYLEMLRQLENKKELLMKRHSGLSQQRERLRNHAYNTSSLENPYRYHPHYSLSPP